MFDKNYNSCVFSYIYAFTSGYLKKICINIWSSWLLCYSTIVSSYGVQQRKYACCNLIYGSAAPTSIASNIKPFSTKCFAERTEEILPSKCVSVAQCSNLNRNEWCFRPQFSTVRLYWARDNRG